MGNRGVQPSRTEPIKWTPEVAYAVGLITTDGSLSKNGRHIDLTSKDKEQIETFKKCLGIEHIKTGKKYSSQGHMAYRAQFGDVVFYKFLNDIGLTKAKTKTIGQLNIPREYLFHFLRGHLDGDGCFYSFWDKRWKNSFMFYTVFVAKSKRHLQWIRSEIKDSLNISGHLCKAGSNRTHNLKYAKSDSLKLLRKIYPSTKIPHLKRKRLKIEKALSIVDKELIK